MHANFSHFHFQANAIVNSLIENERTSELGKVVVDEVCNFLFIKFALLACISYDWLYVALDFVV